MRMSYYPIERSHQKILKRVHRQNLTFWLIIRFLWNKTRKWIRKYLLTSDAESDTFDWLLFFRSVFCLCLLQNLVQCLLIHLTGEWYIETQRPLCRWWQEPTCDGMLKYKNVGEVSQTWFGSVKGRNEKVEVKCEWRKKTVTLKTFLLSIQWLTWSSSQIPGSGKMSPSYSLRNFYFTFHASSCFQFFT